MKMKDVDFLQEKLDFLFKFPMIKANIKALSIDFIRVYKNVQNIDHPEEIPEAHLQRLKSDLFTAFCHGAIEASNMESEFRRTFSLSQEIMDEMAKPKLILPNSKLVI